MRDGGGGRAHQLRGLVALVKDLGSVSNTYMVAHNRPQLKVQVI